MLRRPEKAESMLAPWLRRSRVASMWAFRLATHNGVTPYLFVRSTSAPWSAQPHKVSVALPACDKVCRPAVLPVRPLDLGAVLEAQLRHREVVILAREVQRCTVSPRSRSSVARSAPSDATERGALPTSDRSTSAPRFRSSVDAALPDRDLECRHAPVVILVDVGAAIKAQAHVVQEAVSAGIVQVHQGSSKVCSAAASCRRSLAPARASNTPRARSEETRVYIRASPTRGAYSIPRCCREPHRPGRRPARWRHSRLSPFSA